MNLKDFLKEYPIINKAGLAKMLWSENKSANTKLANKLAENAGQRITEKDLAEVQKVFEKLCSESKNITL